MSNSALRACQGAMAGALYAKHSHRMYLVRKRLWKSLRIVSLINLHQNNSVAKFDAQAHRAGMPVASQRNPNTHCQQLRERQVCARATNTAKPLDDQPMPMRLRLTSSAAWAPLLTGF